MTGVTQKDVGLIITNLTYSKIAKGRKCSTTNNVKKNQSSGFLSKSSIPKPCQNKKNMLKEAKQVLQHEDIVFEKDENALESILNNVGVTDQLLQKNDLQKGRSSMVSNNTFLYLDGRLSLCRRVPLQQAKPLVFNRRHTFAGPKRVLSTNSKSRSCKSLYSVVQGRYSNVDSFSNEKQTDRTERNKAMEPNYINTKSNSHLFLKTPPPVSRRPCNVGSTASPALRIKLPVDITPQPQRSAKKKGQQRIVKWADENLIKFKDVSLESSFKLSTPNFDIKQSVASPVSILRVDKSDAYQHKSHKKPGRCGRSVQGELLNSMKQTTISFHSHLIDKNDAKPQQPNESDRDKTKDLIDSKQSNQSRNFSLLTPKTVQEFREHADEDTKKEFDDLTRETEKMNNTILKLMQQKKSLEAFQNEMRSSTSSQHMQVPDPLFPPPPRTPVAFRTLKMGRSGASSRRVFGATPVKQQFDQALLDEEVSLLTCRVLKSSNSLHCQSDNNPVAHSLAHGDYSHFVPIVKTPASPPKRHHRKSSFNESAFSKYLQL